MKILAIYHDYDCDMSPCAHTLRSVIEQQPTRGRRIIVFTSQYAAAKTCRLPQPGCKTNCEVDVRRLRLLPERNGRRLLRAVNIAWFLLRALFHAMANRYDVVIASNHPRVLIGLVLRIIHAVRGTPYVYICQDLYPESAIVAGDLKHGRLYNRLLRWDTAACTRARRTVVPSREMAETLAERGVPADRISVISGTPINSNLITRQTLPSPLNDGVDTTRFLFTGQLNRRYGLERLIAAARLVAARVPFQLIFIGEGSAKSDLIELAGDLVGRRIVFLPPQLTETVLSAMRTCHYGIVSLAADAHRFTYPHESNLYGQAGCPVIALIEPHTELAQTIERHDLGCVVASRSVSGIAESILKAVIERRQWSPERRAQLENRCRALYGHAATQHAWDEIIAGAPPASMVAPQSGPTSKAA